MTTSDMFFVSLHLLNRDSEEAEKVIILNDQVELLNYIDELIDNISKQKDVTYFGQTSPNTQVFNCINGIFSDPSCREKLTNEIANRLLKSEKDSQERVKSIQELRKGSLIQSVKKTETDIQYVLAKVDHSSILDDSDWRKHSGLPIEKKIITSCIIHFNFSFEFLHAIIYDTTTSIPHYWWEGFLELKKLSTDEENTKKAFDRIDNFLTKTLKGDHSNDYTILRNSTIGYFKSNTTYVHSELVNQVFRNYTPESTELDYNEVILKKIEELPEKKKFERRFNITKEVITARIKRTYHINDKIDLNLKDHIIDLENVIWSDKLNSDEFVLVIRTNEQIFKEFNFKATKDGKLSTIN